MHARTPAPVHRRPTAERVSAETLHVVGPSPNSQNIIHGQGHGLKQQGHLPAATREHIRAAGGNHDHRHRAAEEKLQRQPNSGSQSHGPEAWPDPRRMLVQGQTDSMRACGDDRKCQSTIPGSRRDCAEARGQPSGGKDFLCNRGSRVTNPVSCVPQHWIHHRRRCCSARPDPFHISSSHGSGQVLGIRRAQWCNHGHHGQLCARSCVSSNPHSRRSSPSPSHLQLSLSPQPFRRSSLV
ncbi:hypothetical protein B0H66DRAFT_9090 [Apodospora peruviana]|uniref:Uncharacterized protein n=1 Tax=Apodospora peruviana TaxID=516989 RepID=A0AAE0MDW7_9PEZI|nr:hypothetical protein B0H66DRAFT_9090 [Apodospora peruviana]